MGILAQASDMGYTIYRRIRKIHKFLIYCKLVNYKRYFYIYFLQIHSLASFYTHAHTHTHTYSHSYMSTFEKAIHVFRS